MKRILKLIFLLMLIFTVAGCTPIGKEDNAEKIKIVCTTFPQYDWTREVIKGAEDGLELILLADNGADIHSYQLTADDMIKIMYSDMIIYTGGNSEAWISDALKNSDNADLKVLKMLDIIENDAIYEHHEHDRKAVNEKDEHVWLSISNAKRICDEIEKGLAEIDPNNTDLYKKNKDEYFKRLDELDNEYRNVIETSIHNTLVFADRFPFKYLTDEYGLSYYAAFPGCSAETEASFEMIINLAKELDRLKLGTVLITDNSDTTLARTVIENTSMKNQKILSLASMQSITKDELEEGKNYYDIMRSNLDIIEEALN